VNFEEHAAKALLKARGMPVPSGRTVDSPDAAADAARALGGPCVVKAQAPTGRRGKAGGIRPVDTPGEACAAAAAILGMTIDGHRIDRLLVEQRIAIASELYAAVLTDSVSRGPVLLFSAMGGMDVEEIATADPGAVRRIEVDIAAGLTPRQAATALEGIDLAGQTDAVSRFLAELYAAYRALDADLLEINPLALTDDGRLLCLDCKYVLDDSSAGRQAPVAEMGAPERMTALEAEAHEAGLNYIELDGSVGVLANGAGLTMATMDAIVHYGGRPANFLEIGGEAYTKAETALSILIRNSNIRSLLINFCGAFARTDVMAEGVVQAWRELDPDIPVFFSIHGTGEEEAVALVEHEIGYRPYELMDDAVRAAVGAAGAAGAGAAP